MKKNKDIAGAALTPDQTVSFLNDKELTELAIGEGAELPKNWEQFPLEAKKVAVKNLLSGGYTKLGFKVLEPNFLDTLREIGNKAREGIEEIESFKKWSKKSDYDA